MRSTKTLWFEPLGTLKAWSLSALLVTTIVSTIAFGFGNIGIVVEQPRLTLGANTVVTIGVFLVLRAVTALAPGRLSSKASAVVVFGALVALSALRGVALWWFLEAFAIDSNQSVLMRTMVSVTVFGTSVLLSVLAVFAVSQWRADESTLRRLDEQRTTTRAAVTQAIDEQTKEVASLLEHHLAPRLREMESVSAERSREILNDTLATVVKPLSADLHNRFPTLSPPIAQTPGAKLGEFMTLALTGQPLAPVLTGLVFGLTLLPRHIAETTPMTALLWTVVLGLAITVGSFTINTVSASIPPRLPLGFHVALVVIMLLGLGAGISVLSRVLSNSNLGFDNTLLVGAAATTILAVLLGGVVNARRYFQTQREKVEYLEAELAKELSGARQLQWQRNKSLGTLLHGSLQASLNAGSIRLAKALDSESARAIVGDVARDLSDILLQLRTSDPGSSTLSTTIERVTDTWDDTPHCTGMLTRFCFT